MNMYEKIYQKRYVRTMYRIIVVRALGDIHTLINTYAAVYSTVITQYSIIRST